MDGICDVNGCDEPTFMGWRPLTERRGRQICEQHWRRHLDEKDSFDLYDAFKFRRPEHKPRRPIQMETRRCGCGRELLAGHRFCAICAKERERRRKKRAYHERKNPKPEQVEQENTLRCKQCGRERKAGYTYCSECAKHRKTMTRRQAQSRYWRKRHKVAV
jgi:hypothetical protein